MARRSNDSQRIALNRVRASKAVVPEAEETGAFVRENTGLKKNASMLDAVALNVSSMSAGAALATIGSTMVVLPKVAGVNLVDASLIAFVLSIPQIIVYTMMTKRLPRTGGDYVWVSRTLGGRLGSALGFMGYTMRTLAYLALIALSAVFAIGSVELFFDPSSRTALGLKLSGDIPGSNPLLQAGIAISILAAIVAVNVLRPRLGYVLVSVLAVLGMATLVLGIFVILGAGNAGVSSYVDSIGLSAGDANLTYGALASSYTGPSLDLSASLFVLPFFAMFIYPWLNAGPAVAPEIRGPRGMRWNVPVASLIVMVLVTSGFAAMYYAGGYQFVTAALSNPALVVGYSFNFWTLAMGVSSSRVIAWLLGIGWVLWVIAILAYGVIVESRYLFAQAFDRFLPEKVAYVNPRLGSPAVALLIELVVTGCFVAVGSVLYGGFKSLYGVVIASMIYFVFVGVAAVLHAMRKEKGSAKVVLSVSGALMAGAFVFVVYEFLANPTVWGTGATVMGIPGYSFAYLYVALSFLLGLGLYTFSKRTHGREGLNIDQAYEEIPPD